MMFTPTTPYVHKFRTELCKTWEAYGKCKYGDEVSSNLNLFNLFNFQHEIRIWITFGIWIPIFKFKSLIE